jgi:hypothetical protein
MKVPLLPLVSETTWGVYKCKVADDESYQLSAVGADDWHGILQAMSEEDDDPDDKDSDQGNGGDQLEDNVLAKFQNRQWNNKGGCNLNW